MGSAAMFLAPFPPTQPPSSPAGMDVDDASFLPRARAIFESYAARDEDIRGAVAAVKDARAYVACPHTGAGLHACTKYLSVTGAVGTPLVCMATAHPGKFGDSVEDVVGKDGAPMQPFVPDCLRSVLAAPKRCLHAAGTVDAIRAIVDTTPLANTTTVTH